MQKCQLIFGAYNHLPEGSGASAFEETYQTCWRPFLSALYRFPDVASVLYYSGTVLRWLEARHPEFIMLLEEMMLRKQIELLGGGFFAPILPLVPSPDRVGQIELLTTYIRKAFGKRPRGCWLQDYAWEPGLASALQTCGFDYTFLPERHFLLSGIGGAGLGEPAITEDQGRSIVVIPSFDARESFPEPLPPYESAGALRERLGDLPLLSLLYPGESARDLWLASGLESPDVCFERAFSALQRSSLEYETTTPSRYLKGLRQYGRAYFSSSGSSFLMERSLRPCADAPEGRGAESPEGRGADRGARPPRAGAEIRDCQSASQGSPRRILLRHPESLAMYAKMHYVRILVGQLRGDKSRKKTAQEELWRGQCGDAYWQGPRGGIASLPVRAAAYSALIEAEKTTRHRGSFAPSIIQADIDFDGQKEILYQGSDLNAYLHLEGGCLTELDSIRTRTNYVNVLSERSLGARRAGLRDRIYASGAFEPDRGSFARAQYSLVEKDGPAHAVRLSRDGFFELEGRTRPLGLRKTLVFRRGGFTADYELLNSDVERARFRFGVEFNLAAGFAPSLVAVSTSLGRDRTDLDPSVPRSLPGMDGVRLENLKQQEQLELRSDAAFELRHEPVFLSPEGCSPSEGGAEPLYQGCRLVLGWDTELEPDASRRVSITLELRA